MLSLPVLGLILAGMALVMSAGWLYQRAAGNSGWIDVFWTFGTGAAGMAAALLPFAAGEAPSSRQALAAAIIALWAVRLGGYIAKRVAGGGEDARYRRFKDEWGAAYQARIYILILPQALITTLLCVSIMVAANRPETGLALRDILAFAVLIAAIAGESLADWQLARFKAANTKKGAICDRGLWAWSRHPNYFFEWLGWLAWPVMGLDPARPITWLTLIAPLAMYVVLRFMTGVPPLEETMLKSRGAAYEAYQKRTSAFMLLPPKNGA